MSRRWLFADQLGPHFLDDPAQPVLLIESRAAFARRPVHRRRAHLLLSALRHRAAELGDQAVLIRARTYREGLETARRRGLVPGRGDITVCGPTSRAAERFVRGLPGVTIVPARGFATSAEEFAGWMRGRGRRRLLLEDFYRDARRRLGILMDGADPAGGRWNFDLDNREPPDAALSLAPRTVFAEDDIDREVRGDLDAWARSGQARLTGRDGLREFPVTRDEAVTALRDFIRHRLPAFGPQQDAMLAADPVMAHSLPLPSLVRWLVPRPGDSPATPARPSAREVR